MDATNRFAQILLGYRRQFEFIPTYSAHFTGRFLPWHRLYLHTMEGLLGDKCGYKGYMAYWDWTIGFGTFPNASSNFELSNGAFRDIIRAYPVAHHIQRNYTLRVSFCELSAE